MEAEIAYVEGRTARARLRGRRLLIRIPRHWPESERRKAIARFTRWGERQLATLSSRCGPASEPAAPPMSLEALTALVHRINAESFRVPVAGVRLGSARYTRLAQINLRTRVVTFSRFAVDGMPERALRYLVLHELAHLLEANHSRRFWALVARYEPDYRHQRRIAQDHYHRQVEAAERAESHVKKPEPPAPPPPRHPVPPLPVFGIDAESGQLRLFPAF